MVRDDILNEVEKFQERLIKESSIKLKAESERRQQEVAYLKKKQTELISDYEKKLRLLEEKNDKLREMLRDRTGYPENMVDAAEFEKLKEENKSRRAALETKVEMLNERLKALSSSSPGMVAELKKELDEKENLILQERRNLRKLRSEYENRIKVLNLKLTDSSSGRDEDLRKALNRESESQKKIQELEAEIKEKDRLFSEINSDFRDARRNYEEQIDNLKARISSLEEREEKHLARVAELETKLELLEKLPSPEKNRDPEPGAGLIDLEQREKELSEREDNLRAARERFRERISELEEKLRRQEVEEAGYVRKITRLELELESLKAEERRDVKKDKPIPDGDELGLFGETGDEKKPVREEHDEPEKSGIPGDKELRMRMARRLRGLE